jgi:2-amino-4-hydroxy-6-hydroxymethyldihydropteridine diphosphokinase
MTEIACAIGLGSNLGPSQQILEQSIEQLRAIPQINNIRVSHWYCTKPVGPPQPDYLNGCATFMTSLNPWQVLEVLQSIEQQFGRERQVHWGARTLDLDLLLYGGWQIDTVSLQVPHPYMAERSFVLVPLAEIAGNFLCHGVSINDLRLKLNYDDNKCEPPSKLRCAHDSVRESSAFAEETSE